MQTMNKYFIESRIEYRSTHTLPFYHKSYISEISEYTLDGEYDFVLDPKNLRLLCKI